MLHRYIVLFLTKVGQVDRLLYALHGIWHRYRADSSARTDNDWD